MNAQERTRIYLFLLQFVHHLAVRICTNYMKNFYASIIAGILVLPGSPSRADSHETSSPTAAAITVAPPPIFAHSAKGTGITDSRACFTSSHLANALSALIAASVTGVASVLGDHFERRLFSGCGVMKSRIEAVRQIRRRRTLDKEDAMALVE